MFQSLYSRVRQNSAYNLLLRSKNDEMLHFMEGFMKVTVLEIFIVHKIKKTYVKINVMNHNIIN